MTELRQVLDFPEIQEKIKEGKRHIYEHRAAVDAGKKRVHPSLLNRWNAKHQRVVEDYIAKVIAFVDQSLASNLAGLSREAAWVKLWQLEDKQGDLTKISDEHKRRFEKLIDGRYMRDSVHGGPLYFLFDLVGTQVAMAVFKLKFGDN